MSFSNFVFFKRGQDGMHCSTVLYPGMSGVTSEFVFFKRDQDGLQRSTDLLMTLSGGLGGLAIGFWMCVSSQHLPVVAGVEGCRVLVSVDHTALFSRSFVVQCSFLRHDNLCTLFSS